MRSLSNSFLIRGRPREYSVSALAEGRFAEVKKQLRSAKSLDHAVLLLAGNHLGVNPEDREGLLRRGNKARLMLRMRAPPLR